DSATVTVASVAKEMGLNGLSVDAAMNATDKSRMRAVLSKRNLPNPKYISGHNLEDVTRELRELSFPLVIKPADNSAGRGIQILYNAESIPNAFENARKFSNNGIVVLEEFLDGVEHTVEGFVNEGEVHIFGVSDKIKIEPPYCVATNLIYPTNLPRTHYDALKELNKKVVDAVGIDTGPIHAEYISNGGNIRIVEIAARTGGGKITNPIIEHISGIDPVEKTIKMALGDDLDQIEPEIQRGAVYRFFRPTPGILKKIHNMDKARNIEGILSLEVWIKPGDRIYPMIDSMKRIGHIVAGSDTRENAIRFADLAEETIMFEIE
ncbi:MAG: ATP-grasp domain-containing protein, partial [Candidatus Thorarchaeota archaeon]|nr:ATP-grasp domain-containing protein [Candidatus Thorarchaeota archaeon]